MSMATTAHYNLIKPEYTDPADIGDINDNMDKIDTALYGMKTKQAAVSSPAATGTASAFIDTISQDANGKITATKKTVVVSNAGVTLAWGTSKTIGSVAGTNLTATLPSKPAPTKAEVDSALGAGSGTTYYRKDGTWATPTNTTYESKAAASGGTAVSLCTTGEKYTWNQNNSKVSCTTANVKSALSIGSGSTFLRKDGSWATPANTWRDYDVKAYHVGTKFNLLAGETKSVAGNDLKDENNNTLATPSGYRAVGAVYFSPGHSSCTVDLVSVSSTGTDTVLRVRNTSSNTTASNVDPKITIFYIKTGSP